MIDYLRMAWPYITRQQKYMFAFTLSLSVITGALEVALAGLVGLFATLCASPEKIIAHPRVIQADSFFGGFFTTAPQYLALLMLVVLFLCVAVRNILQIIHFQMMFGLSQRIASTLCSRTLDVFLRLPYLTFKEYTTSTAIVLLGAGQRIGLAFSQLLLIGSSMLTLLILMSAVIGTAPVAASIFTVSVAVGGFFILRLTRAYVDTCAKNDVESGNNMLHLGQTLVNGMREIRLAGKSETVYSFYDNVLGLRRKIVQKTMSMQRLPSYSLETFGFFMLAATAAMLVWIQGFDLARLAATMGLLAAASWRALPIASGIVAHLTVMRSTFPIWDRQFDLLGKLKNADARLLLESGASVSGPLAFKKHILFDNVVLRYREEPALSIQSLAIGKGELVGVVGRSGAGKSSFVNVLTGLIPPGNGRIFIDDTPLNNENVRAWQMNVACVSQDPYLLDASVAENIAFSDFGKEIDTKRVRKCARMASMDFLQELPRGINSGIGERGSQLSGGQLQRLAIARALYSRPSVLVFDEATSSLDLKNEKMIMDTILALRGEITMVIVAHRLTSLEHCDRIVWLDRGRVRRVGGPEEILSRYRSSLSRETAHETQDLPVDGAQVESIHARN